MSILQKTIWKRKKKKQQLHWPSTFANTNVLLHCSGKLRPHKGLTVAAAQFTVLACQTVFYNCKAQIYWIKSFCLKKVLAGYVVI